MVMFLVLDRSKAEIDVNGVVELLWELQLQANDGYNKLLQPMYKDHKGVIPFSFLKIKIKQSKPIASHLWSAHRLTPLSLPSLCPAPTGLYELAQRLYV